jgi:hypothetical protein
MYQGEDFTQQLSYFTDVDELVPVVFTAPVMDIRASDGTLLARFDTSGTSAGLIAIIAPGVLSFTMPHTATALITGGAYALDVFADVGGGREAITKRGLLKLVVTRRITVDDS